jgi:ribosome-associated protein
MAIIMETIKIRDEYIKLGQLLKLAGVVGSGVDAKLIINDGLVQVNGETEYQRGKKIRAGDIVTYNNHSIKVENNDN